MHQLTNATKLTIIAFAVVIGTLGTGHLGEHAGEQLHELTHGLFELATVRAERHHRVVKH